MNKTICFLLKAKQPTEAQLQAGNYLKKKLAYRGLTITVENPAGSSRSGKDRDGHEWTTHMQNDYGYINRTEGIDGDHVDCYIGPKDDAENVFIVHQRKAGDWEKFDEDKAMLGFESEKEAVDAYLKHYDDPRFLGPVTAMPFAEFKEKVLATLEKPAMIKSQIVFVKSLVQPHLRRMKDGRVVSVGGYENNRSKQVELTEEERKRQGDLLAGDTVTESRQELIDEHEHLVDVLNSPSHADDKVEAQKQAEELKEYKDGADKANDDPEAEIRAMWTEQGVSKGRQDELIAQVAAKAKPGAMVGPFRIPEEAPKQEADTFDSADWNKARDERIAESRHAGYVHLDKLEPTVEAMRGKRIQYVHDNLVTGAIRTVDNGGNVYVDWSDDYSAEKEMASPVRDGKRTVMRSSLGPTDLKDYRVRPSKIVVRAKDIR